MAMNADTLSGGWWPGVDGSAGIDAQYRAPPVGQPIDLHRDAAGGSHFEHVLWENGTHSTTLFGREAAAVVERHALTSADGAGLSYVSCSVFCIRISIRGMCLTTRSCLCDCLRTVHCFCMSLTKHRTGRSNRHLQAGCAMVPWPLLRLAGATGVGS